VPYAVLWRPLATLTAPKALLPAPLAVLWTPTAVLFTPLAVLKFPYALLLLVPLAVLLVPLAVLLTPIAVLLAPNAVALVPQAVLLALPKSVPAGFEPAPPFEHSTACAPEGISAVPASKAPAMMIAKRTCPRELVVSAVVFASSTRTRRRAGTPDNLMPLSIE
jgi:hypothetical protein